MGGGFLVAPTEPGQLHAAGTSSSVPEQYGADILIPGDGFLVGVQRKKFPQDFYNSLHDGRLSTSLVKLTKLPVRILLLEGKPAWNASGFLAGWEAGSRGQNYSRAAFWGLLWSAQVQLGVSTFWTADLVETVEFCRDLRRWAQKGRHSSMFNRPGPEKLPEQRQFTERDRAVYFLQGVDGWGPDTAGRVYDHFGRIPLALDVGLDELKEVPGVGPVRAQRLADMTPPLDAERLGVGFGVLVDGETGSWMAEGKEERQ